MEKYRSRSVARKLYYEWEIVDFTSLADTPNFGINGVDHISQKFSVNASFENKWHLELSMTEKRFMAFLVADSPLQPIRAQYSVSILNNLKEKKPAEVYNQFFNARTLRTPEIILIYKHEIFTSTPSEYLPNDVLTICLDLTVYDEYSEIIKSPSKSLKFSIAEDLKKLLDENLASDIILLVNDKEYQAHKAILMARSPVFSAMLTHDMKEKKENKITVPDIDPNIFEKIFEYIYSDKVTDLDSYGEQLLEVADQYQLFGLVELCEESLSKSLTVENAVNMLVVADQFNAQQLLEFTVDFIVSNLGQIKKTDKYQEVINQSNSHLTMKIIERFVKP